MTYTILVVVQVVVALVMIGLILVQHGKGADAGAAFGSGASGTVFGAQGSANFMSRATAGLAVAFFIIALALAYLVSGNTAPTNESVTAQLQQQSAQTSQVQMGGAASSQSESPANNAANGGKATQSQSATSNGDNSSDQGGVTATIPK